MAYQQLGTGGNVPQLQLTAFEKKLISRNRAVTVFNRFGEEKGIPKRGGKAIHFRKLESFLGASYAAAIASGGAYASGPLALTEGTPGAAIDATWVTVSATVSQYGAYIQISDLAEYQSIDDMLGEVTDNFSEQMPEAMDLVTRDILSAGTSVQFASTAASRGNTGSGMLLNLAELREAKRTLMRTSVKPVAKESGRYVVITHPDALFDLEADSNITGIYRDAGVRGEGNEIWDTTFKDLPFGFRLYVTPLARIWASLGLSGADVYGTLVLGEKAYGTIKLDAMPMRIIRKGLGSAGANDPLDQVGTVGWKAAHAAVILDQTRMIRLEHVTSNKSAA